MDCLIIDEFKSEFDKLVLYLCGMLKVKRNYKYLWSLTPAILVIAGNLLGGWWVSLNVIFSLGILAILENFIHEDKSNDVEESQWLPDSILVLHVLTQLFCLSTMIYSVNHFNYSWIQFLLLGLSVGINSGSSAIVISHELVHRRNVYMRSLGQFLLFSACNIYFYVDHLKVHHKWVGTNLDPATARYNESLYVFFIRSTVGQIKSAFRVESHRLKASGKSTWSPSNYIIGSILLQILLWMILVLFFGPLALIIYLVQGFFANFLLEYTNYIEHYGLTRNEKERVTEVHSWQTDRLTSRFFLIDLSRHADHHYYASKPYHKLKSYENSPVLPGGYISMIYYALIPPVFFRKVNGILGNRTSGVSQ